MRKRTLEEVERRDWSEQWAKTVRAQKYARGKVEQNQAIFQGERQPAEFFAAPQSRIRRFWVKIRRLGSPLKLAGLMFVSYGLIAVSFRMLALGSYWGLGITDGLVAWWGFTTVKRIQKAETVWEQIGYTMGGIAGSLLGLWVTK
jgi:hypothetical protein